MIKKDNFITDSRSSSCGLSEAFDLPKMLISSNLQSLVGSHISRNSTKNVRIFVAVGSWMICDRWLIFNLKLSAINEQ